MIGLSESQQTALSEVTASFLQIGECNETMQQMVNKRVPYVLSVQAASPAHKALMQSALEDFDKQMAPAVAEYKQKMRSAFQSLLDHIPVLMKALE